MQLNLARPGMSDGIKQDSDRIFIRLAEGEIIESEEVVLGIVIDYQEDGAVVAVEIDLVAQSRQPRK